MTGTSHPMEPPGVTGQRGGETQIGHRHIPTVPRARAERHPRRPGRRASRSRPPDWGLLAAPQLNNFAAPRTAADLDGSSYHLAGVESAPDWRLCGPKGEGDLISNDERAPGSGTAAVTSSCCRSPAAVPAMVRMPMTSPAAASRSRRILPSCRPFLLRVLTSPAGQARMHDTGQEHVPAADHCRSPSFCTKLTPSPTGIRTTFTRGSAAMASLRERIAATLSSFTRSSATWPPWSMLSRSIRPPGRSRVSTSS